MSPPMAHPPVPSAAMDIDSEPFDEALNAAKQIAFNGDLHGAVGNLLTMEKANRIAEDISKTRLCCLAILEICFEAKEWKMLNEQITVLAKRRGQLKQVIQAFVRQAMEYIDWAPDNESRIELIKSLMAVTEGKIYTEIERARLTKRLAKMKEAEGKISEAADLLQEVAVETYGAMAKSEKIAFILEQVRLCMDTGDFVRAHILSKKISPRAFAERRGEGAGDIGIEGTAIEAPDEDVPSLADLKVLYYHTLIRYHRKFNDYLDICRAYKAMYESRDIAADPEKWTVLLKKIAWYVVLAPQHSTDSSSSSDQATLLKLTMADRNLNDLPLHKQLLKTFLTRELVHWPSFLNDVETAIAEEADIFSGEEGAIRLRHLKFRITEHNLLVASQYYSRMHMKRLSALLDLSVDEAEKHVSELVVKKALNAKIDRPSGVVVFSGSLQSDAILNDWACNISKLLGLVEKSCQQIQKECMQYKITIGSS